MKHTLLQQKGFTLVETLVAISILMLAILGPLSIASAGLRNSIYARDQITAFYLAQEGIEYVRYARDDNYMKTVQFPANARQWLEGLELCMVDSGTPEVSQRGCAIDAYEWSKQYQPEVDEYIVRCRDQYCEDPILYVTPQGKYTTVSLGNNLAHFTRQVKIEEVNTSVAIVRSTVTWMSGGGGRKSFTITEYLHNIYNL
jgi:prepilin-type N-terminal cleavage/methylation domain-containing protein